MVESERAHGVTVGEAAEAAGVTVRTLHHWDEIGLASPSIRTSAGHRRYTEDDLERLRRVVAYRDAGLGLDAIREIVDGGAGIAATLRDHRAHLAERIDELRRLDENLGRLSEAHERGVLLRAEEQSAVFGPEWDAGRSADAHALWGGTRQWAQFAERSASRSRQEWQALADAMSALQNELARASDRGVEPGDDDATALAEKHRELFSHFFPLTREMQVCLGRMFASDPGFAGHYNGIRPGLAEWFRRIIDESARAHGIDPDAATWR
ncbi:MerR family transcriptional regulator [Tsukamurella sp. 1534]|uniref:MerR family transcriptional regulator n=1 Tax=Tsukamurella sp. 1534 TaxID=1151061 RepID=UPI00192AA8C0|nr:MerR family transcriptional regulator [Tsukamurella sp. 1534]